jgi:hypothetical protein
MKSKIRGLTLEQTNMVKNASLSILAQEEERIGRRLTETEVYAVLEKFDDELRSRIGRSRS